MKHDAALGELSEGDARYLLIRHDSLMGLFQRLPEPSRSGALGAFAIMMKVEALIVLIGGIFVIEALSVIIQVYSFKLTGRRVFLIAPIHHHFEMKAWSETKIMVRFWIVTGILCAAGFALFYKYYPQIRPPQ